jgi:acetoacetyl-CoA synthetase
MPSCQTIKEMPETVKKLWEPGNDFKLESNLHHYMQWLREIHNLNFNSYHELWQWSVSSIDTFWKTIWGYFEIQYSGNVNQPVVGREMPHYEWFQGTQLNYSEHIFRKASADNPAIIASNENQTTRIIDWDTLSDSVSSIQQYLKEFGVKPGDRIAAFLPCIPEATISFLAVNSLGAVWSSCSPDFGTQSVIDRFAQIEPKILIAVDQYTYNGKSFDRNKTLIELQKSLPSVERLILISEREPDPQLTNYCTWSDLLKIEPKPVFFERVPFSHPIWILYSSGTTGLPKAITHSHGGILLEQLKYLSFHNNIKEGDRCFWYTTTGWMMWNYIQGALLCGGVLVLYDGSPSYKDLNILWKLIQDTKINHFGTSASFIMSCLKNQVNPNQFDLSSLLSIGSTGSTLPEEGFEWIYSNVKSDLWLAPISGGTDVCSAFVGGNPVLPVYSGEIQCRALGCSLQAYNDAGIPVKNEVGEMVITKPMPSMPVFFWNDPEFNRYKESYFEQYPGVWRHGDWIKITEREGIIIYGRSDATLNRGGVRIGTSEVYRALDSIDEIKDSLIICIEKKGGEFWMPLFLVLNNGFSMTNDLQEKIKGQLKTTCSPRHVPDSIHVVPDIPYTISGKKTEMPVKKILMGQHPEKVINPGSLRNPESLNGFVEIAKRFSA